jgi:hypothetical protein
MWIKSSAATFGVDRVKWNLFVLHSFFKTFSFSELLQSVSFLQEVEICWSSDDVWQCLAHCTIVVLDTDSRLGWRFVCLLSATVQLSVLRLLLIKYTRVLLCRKLPWLHDLALIIEKRPYESWLWVVVLDKWRRFEGSCGRRASFITHLPFLELRINFVPPILKINTDFNRKCIT